ncbi:tubulin polyglutamylase TTLL11 [Pelodytes ibericus]
MNLPRATADTQRGGLEAEDAPGRGGALGLARGAIKEPGVGGGAIKEPGAQGVTRRAVVDSEGLGITREAIKESGGRGGALGGTGGAVHGALGEGMASSELGVGAGVRHDLLGQEGLASSMHGVTGQLVTGGAEQGVAAGLVQLGAEWELTALGGDIGADCISGPWARPEGAKQVTQEPLVHGTQIWTGRLRAVGVGQEVGSKQQRAKEVIAPGAGERLSIKVKQDKLELGTVSGGDPEIRGSAMAGCKASGQGEAKTSIKPKCRSRREESEDRQGQKVRLGGAHPESSLSPSASRGASCHGDTREKTDHKLPRPSNRMGPQLENKGVPKKADGRRLKKLVTVDSSKAKTSLEALKISIKQLRWKELPLGRRRPCDIYWHGVSFHESENILSGQVNKFPGMTEMVRKINLSRAMRTMQELFPEEYNFYPQSWILPEEFPIFAAQVRMAKEKDPLWKPTFIVKPDGGCQGDGIYLVKEPNDIRAMGSMQNRPAVVQEYISRPLLMDKLKFDIRLYVVLRSLEPLEIHVAKEGLSRFCTEPYQEPHHKNLHQVFMHLTNYSLNIHSGNFIHSDCAHTGSKRTFSSILYRLSAKGVDTKKVWLEIITLVIKTIIALTPELKVYYQADIPPGKPGPTCFQILGFDILLTKSLKPVLLEVNANPSMKIEHEQELVPGVYENVQSLVDEEVKIAVIRDTLRLVDPAKRKNSHSPLCQPDIALDAEKDLHVGAADRATPEMSQSSETNLPALCLKQVFPKYSKQFNYLRVVERMSSVFIRFLGIKGTMKLGPTGFRTFIRSCKLSSSHFSMASVDILYIDITRRWNSMGPDQRESGMCLQAFVEAFFYLAQRRFKGLPLQKQVESLINLCESHLESLDEKRTLGGRRLAERKTELNGCRQSALHVPSYAPRLNRTSTSYKLTDYKLQHS